MTRRGVFPGSFDPPTVAHLAIAEAAVDEADLDQLDFAISRVALAKEDRSEVDARAAALQRLAAARPWCGVVITDAQLIADIAAGYDVVVMGADKWAQVRDPQWYGSEGERDAALARLPRVLVVPRGELPIEGAQRLEIAPEHADVSSSAVRAGAHHLRAERPARVIVDAMNVIGSRPDGWWKDRDKASRQLIATLQERSRATGERIAVVLDGAPLSDFPEGIHDGILVAYATRAGRNAADDRIVEEVARDREPGSLLVVSSDRGLQQRVQELGAQIAPVSYLRAPESASP